MRIKNKNSFFKHFDFFVADLTVLSLSFVLANLIRLHSLHYYHFSVYSTIFLCLVFSCLCVNIIVNPFSGVLRRDVIPEIRNTASCTAYYFIVTAVLLYLFKLGSLFSRLTIVITYAIYFFASCLVRTVLKNRIFTNGALFNPSSSRMILLCESRDMKSYIDNIINTDYQGHTLTGLCFTDVRKSKKEYKKFRQVCSLDGLSDYVLKNDIDEVLICTSPEKVDRSIIHELVENGVTVHLNVNRIYDIEADHENIEKVGIYKTLALESFSFSLLQLIYMMIKRLFDIVLSLLAFIPLFVLSAIVKIAYYFTGDHDTILYKQIRVGKDGKEFEIYKFRTMAIDAERQLQELLKDPALKKEWEEYHKLKNDPRITKLGMFLRKSSLDEVPQFINVLKGDMSLIGPRPLVPGELKYHNGLKLYEKIRPGITGWWACNGRSNISYEERLEYEYYYVKHVSFSLDLLTFFRTILCVFKKVGAQ